MDGKKVSRRMLLLLAAGMLSEATFARGGRGGGRGRSGGGRGARGRGGGAAGGLWILAFIGGVFGIFWLWGRIVGLSSKGGAPLQPSRPGVPSGVQLSSRVNQTIPDKPPSSEWERLGLCPSCGSAMITRTAKRGRYAGRAFFGCTTYPHCNGTRKKPLLG
ncbi:topoisomerase DNA-binding C4 zinc finger domain-containing protein [Pseudomonas sp. CMR5c]|uniref:topoisomerase DNA-binding C4 zinc finger domain-containing protein n=1 Tax=Pseudomonas sp. CMR5c TaxID=658630 RepID=UPI0015A73D99